MHQPRVALKYKNYNAKVANFSTPNKPRFFPTLRYSLHTQEGKVINNNPNKNQLW